MGTRHKTPPPWKLPEVIPVTFKQLFSEYEFGGHLYFKDNRLSSISGYLTLELTDFKLVAVRHYEQSLFLGDQKEHRFETYSFSEDEDKEGVLNLRFFTIGEKKFLSGVLKTKEILVGAWFEAIEIK